MGLSILMFLGGLALVLYFAEKLVQGAVGTSAGFGVSTFVISVVFIGFDPENLAVGAVGSYESASGIALGSVMGAAMVAMALAFGVTAMIVPMEFERAPRSILAVPPLTVLLFAVLAWDGMLSRVDGGVLLAAFVLAVLGLFWMSRLGIDIKPGGEVGETLQQSEPLSRWKALGLLVVSLAAIVAGSEMLLGASRTMIARLGLSETFFGMTILALLVSFEEIARELPAALRGRPEISYGNVVGSALAFFCFNAGVISLVRPVPVEPQVIQFYLPPCCAAVLITSGAMIVGKVPRWAGAVLVLLYLVFVIGGYRASAHGVGG